MGVLTRSSHFTVLHMTFNDEDEKEIGVLSDDAIGEVLDEDADSDEAPIVPAEDDEKAWE